MFRDAGRRLGLCVLLAVNGAALAFFGFVQQLTWKGLIVLEDPRYSPAAPVRPLCLSKQRGRVSESVSGRRGGHDDLAGGRTDRATRRRDVRPHATSKGRSEKPGIACGLSFCIWNAANLVATT